MYEGTHKGCPYGCWGRGAVGVGRVYEGTHEGCPYGCWGRGAVGVGRVYEGTHKGCPYGYWGRGAVGVGRVYEGTHKGCPYGHNVWKRHMLAMGRMVDMRHVVGEGALRGGAPAQGRAE